jgi:PAS domain S-box-containing protein
MSGKRILIVEDERIVAEDLHDMLKRLNYDVVGICSSGDEGVEKAGALRPDIVLMDIRLNGEMDGVEAAELIFAQHGIPVTYLTAYADENTLERAKATLPFGYILKPFEERDLRTTIEIALYKHSMESTLKKMDGWHASALENLTDPVIATNAQGGITFMNPAAETLTGWTLRQVLGRKFSETFQVSADTGPRAASGPRFATEKRSAHRAAGLLKTKDGQQVRVEYGVNPLKDENGQNSGNVILLHPSTQNRETHSAV